MIAVRRPWYVLEEACFRADLIYNYADTTVYARRLIKIVHFDAENSFQHIKKMPPTICIPFPERPSSGLKKTIKQQQDV